MLVEGVAAIGIAVACTSDAISVTGIIVGDTVAMIVGVGGSGVEVFVAVGTNVGVTVKIK